MTPAQFHCLNYLRTYARDHLNPDPHPSGHMRTPDIPNPGAVLRRMAFKRWVKAGANTPEGRLYHITRFGIEAWGKARKELAER